MVFDNLFIINSSLGNVIARNRLNILRFVCLSWLRQLATVSVSLVGRSSILELGSCRDGSLESVSKMVISKWTRQHSMCSERRRTGGVGGEGDNIEHAGSQNNR